MTHGFSPFAHLADDLRSEVLREAKTWGLCVHQVGVPKNGVVRTARQIAKLFARRPSNFTHYVIGRNGSLTQVASELVRSWHAGLAGPEVKAYRLGTWRARVCAEVRRAWSRTFYPFDSPLDLFPGRDPNEAYISVELIPHARDHTFTKQQYETLATLIRDVWRRHELPSGLQWPGPPRDDHWSLMRRQGRLVGHEDVNPLKRTTRRGGWCPGSTGRTKPYFHWNRLISILESRR